MGSALGKDKTKMEHTLKYPLLGASLKWTLAQILLSVNVTLKIADTYHINTSHQISWEASEGLPRGFIGGDR